MNKYKAESKKAQQERKYQRACGRKKPFATEADALAQKGMDVYLCRFCNKWHRTKVIPDYIRKKRNS